MKQRKTPLLQLHRPVLAILLTGLFFFAPPSRIGSVLAASDKPPSYAFPVPDSEVDLSALEIIDFDEPPEAEKRLTDYVNYGVRIESEYETRKNYDLNRSVKDDEMFIEPVISLSATVRPNDDIKIYTNLRYSREFALIEEGEADDHRPNILRLSQLYIQLEDLFLDELDLTFGRQRIDDDREWHYDDKFDALRLEYMVPDQQPDIRLDFALTWDGILDEDFINDEDKRRANNYFFRVEYRPAKGFKIIPYLIYRHDFSDRRERPLFIGLLTAGKIADTLEYWAEIAHVQGRRRIINRRRHTERAEKFKGIGLDTGLIYTPDLPLDPALILGFAFGSGDDEPGDGDDRGYRQTGLEDNESKLSGLSSVKHYGEVFDPELSNMLIFTAGAGIRPHKKFSLEVLYHYYLQHRAVDDLRSTDTDQDPAGESKRLGSEIDFVAALKDIYNFDLEFVAGIFLPDRAFDPATDNKAYLFETKVRYDF